MHGRVLMLEGHVVCLVHHHVCLGTVHQVHAHHVCGTSRVLVETVVVHIAIHAKGTIDIAGTVEAGSSHILLI